MVLRVSGFGVSELWGGVEPRGYRRPALVQPRQAQEPLVSGFGFQVLGFGFRFPVFGFRVSDFGFRVQGLEMQFRVAGLGLRNSGLGFRV